MTHLIKKQQAAIASRKASRAHLAARRSAILVLPAPQFDTLNSNGLISYDNSKKPFPITVDVSSFDLDPSADRVSIYMRGRGASQWGAAIFEIRFDRPGDPSLDDPIVRELPVSRLTPGEHEIGYAVWEGQVTPTYSFPAPLQVDHTPPFDREHPPAPSLPDYVVTAGEINKAVMDANPEGLVCTFADYPIFRQPGDHIEAYLASYPSSQLSSPIDTFPVTDDLDFTLEWADLDLSAGGQFYLFLVYIDLAGNKSKDSTPAPVLVKVIGDPIPLAAEVDLAPPGDDLIDLEDAQNPDGVHAIIREYTNFQVGDVIELSWGGQPAVRYDAGLYLPFPLYLPIPEAAIFADYADGTGEKPTTINHFVDRGGITTDAPPKTIAVDLSSPGPIPGPDPENSLLELATVIGSDPNQPNVLLPADFGLDATLQVVLWNVPVPAPGIIIQPYYGDLAHPLTPQTLSTEGAGATLTFNVPWQFVREVGNGPAIPVFYTLSWATNNNIQKSPSQPVDVRANQVTLEAPTFRKATTPMACADLEPVSRAAVIRVPGNTMYFKEFDVIKVEWQIFSDAAGTVPLGDPFEFFSLPLTPDMVSNGFNLTIQPYATVVRPAARNSVDIHYFVNIPGEGEVKSQRGFTTTRFANLGGQFCEELLLAQETNDE